MVLVFQEISICEADTVALAKRVARELKTGDIVAFYGTLGAGKTAFCRGLIQALCSNVQEVPSPTFTLLQIYEAPDFPIYHFDMYRLKEPDEAYEIGIEDAFAEGVCLIEWPEKIGTLLPKKHWKITIEMTENNRLITVEKPE